MNTFNYLTSEERLEHLRKKYMKEKNNSKDTKNELYEIKPNYTLYSIEDNYFESYEVYLVFCKIKKLPKNKLLLINYYYEYANQKDVIKLTQNNNETICSIIDEHYYKVFNKEKSEKTNSYVWDTCEGNIRKYYDVLKERGINFERDLYGHKTNKNNLVLKLLHKNK